MGIETLAIGGLAASVIGSGVSAFGASKTAEANAESAEYKAAVARNNSIIAQRNADQATAAGNVAAQVEDLKTKNLEATQLVTQASNGLDVGSGTNVNVRQSAHDIGHLDTLTILANAAKNAQGFKSQGMNFQAEAGLDTKTAGFARDAGDINVASSLLGGAASFGDKWASYSQKGVFS